MEVDHEWAQFSYAVGDEPWQMIGDPVSAAQLSSDFIKENGKLAFTGAMVGICAQDMDNHRSYADFDFFTYTESHS